MQRGVVASRDSIYSLRDELKSETAALHLSVEAQLDLFDSPLSLGRYREVLEAFYGFYAPLEAGLFRLAADVPPLGFSLRAHTELIESDLVALGVSRRALTEVAMCTELPPLSSREDLAGCLYVLEGACLGGQVVAKRLQRQLAIAKGNGASFFVGDGDGTAARWRVVMSWLESLVDAGARPAQIVGSARATFVALSRWLERQQGARSV